MLGQRNARKVRTGLVVSISGEDVTVELLPCFTT